jgi:hypothetical protein
MPIRTDPVLPEEDWHYPDELNMCAWHGHGHGRRGGISLQIINGSVYSLKN